MAIQCTRCGSEKIVPQAPVVGAETSTIRAHLEWTPPGWLVLPRHADVDLYARVCGECGYTELFAADPEGFYGAYLKSLE